MKILWSPLAIERLEDTYDYIARENPSAAQELIERIFRKVESLPSDPGRGRVVPEINREEIRELFEGEYRIIYRVESAKLFILTIRNFKQKLPGSDIE